MFGAADEFGPSNMRTPDTDQASPIISAIIEHARRALIELRADPAAAFPVRLIPRLLPARAGNRLNVATTYRWVTTGVDGGAVRLEAAKVGREFWTDLAALERFLLRRGIAQEAAP